LPALPEKPNLSDASIAVATSPLWGARPKEQAQKAQEDARWAVAGIFVREGERSTVAIRFAAGRPAQILTTGDEFPDGAKISLIEPGKVCTVKNRQQTCIRLPAGKPHGF
jgi:hypothetical protein